MSPRTIEMTPTLHDYFLSVSLREPPVLARLRAETLEAAGDRAGMQISPEQGQLMALLVELTGARRMIEIGTFTGYSALVCALAMPADGLLIACDLSTDWTAIARRYWREAGVDARIDLRIGPALETLDALLGPDAADAGTFDMAFIDADKTNYGAYYERCLRLIRPGGLILVDNVLWGGSVIDPAKQDEDTRAIRAFNARLHADNRVSMSLVPIGDGLTLVRRRDGGY